MDLSTLKKKLDGGNLSGMSDFKRYVLLMFANAVMFNSTGHDVNHYAKEMAADALSSLRVLHLFSVSCQIMNIPYDRFFSNEV